MRKEWTVAISKPLYDELMLAARGYILFKTRYFKEGIEVDVYQGHLPGLVVAEVEFDSQDACEAFEPPDWFGEEVTGVRKYSNAALSQAEGLP